MLLVFLFSIYISITDWFTHRISNRSITIIALLLLLHGNFRFHLLSGLLILTLFLLAGALGGLGGGDIKLLGTVGLCAIPTVEIYQFLLYLLTYSTCLVILIALVRKTMRGSVAFAPAICASYLTVLMSR
jgi:Flp pilus assembly protein protease CpaA